MDPVKLAQAAKLAYPSTCSQQETEIQIHRMFPGDPWGIRFINVSRTDTEGYVMRSGNQVLVVFSGTESLRDLLTDAWFIPGAYYYGNQPMVVHSGFAGAIGAAGPQVFSAFRELYAGDLDSIGKAVVIAAGHSLGASIALGALDALHYQYAEIRGHTRAVTFGCPNGWGKAARSAWNIRHCGSENYVNQWDYVTRLLGLTTGRPGWDIKLSGRCGHFMDKYIENLEAMRDGQT